MAEVKWVTNSHVSTAGKDMAALNYGWRAKRNLYISDPQATEACSVSELVRMGMVGIWESA